MSRLKFFHTLSHPSSASNPHIKMEQERAIIKRDRIGEEVVLVQLTESNKEQLLGKATKFLTNRQPEAAIILERMAQLNANVARDFALKDAASSRAPLRLLFSRDSTVVKDLSQPVPSYIIISYCWKSPGWSKTGFSKVEQPWPIQHAFVEDLLQLRESADEGIWIDQLSIDQKDDQEKKVAIGAMDILYRSARQLVIILEDIEIPQEEEEIANRYWKVVQSAIPSDQWNPPESDLKLIESLFLRIMSSRWFSRGWCSHEFQISKYYLEDLRNFPRFRA
ncbi:hypothetical protein K469DRAFT_285135 [Zopfia rhizophila CBS 207.26]|uniref:Heterokaryon incompatibility domain-containing protein n=1 Tax=Zopfia rhizophila CBS 207.26 TaxID=1314779 RepID=A0A6A6EQ33_9PEZI|nr:hypothetical protein K469DRAFT_285135 [Zopfia rhizophila CBS 207.26]